VPRSEHGTRCPRAFISRFGIPTLRQRPCRDEPDPSTSAARNASGDRPRMLLNARRESGNTLKPNSAATCLTRTPGFCRRSAARFNLPGASRKLIGRFGDRNGERAGTGRPRRRGTAERSGSGLVRPARSCLKCVSVIVHTSQRQASGRPPRRSNGLADLRTRVLPAEPRTPGLSDASASARSGSSRRKIRWISLGAKTRPLAPGVQEGLFQRSPRCPAASKISTTVLGQRIIPIRW